ncbi:MAG TPA: ACT domain-containing protein [Eubacteriaceae bacterium]|nr:ACT domain-containing protein [Eubacteriaceae bacterium]
MKAIITVIGSDRVGIIYNVSKILNDYQANILDISQTIMHDYFTMMMLVDLDKMNGEFNQLKLTLEELESSIGVSVKIQREEIFKTMHNI